MSYRLMLLKRFIVTVIYIGATVGILYLVVDFSSSKACYERGSCDHSDQIMFAIMGVADFILAFVYFVAGMKGFLPGARKTSGEIELE